MSLKCGKCDTLTTAGDGAVNCSSCKLTFHSKCVQSFTKAKTRSWECEICGDQTSSTTSVDKDSRDRMWFLNALEDMKEKIDSKTDEKVSNLKQQLLELKEQLNFMETAKQVLRQRCDTLEEENARLRGEMHSARVQLLDVEQYTLSKNLEIVGIPVTAHEDIYTCLEMLAGVISVKYKREDISIAHRLRVFSKKHAHAPVIVQFMSRTARDAWLSAARCKKNIETREISAKFRPGRVFVNEHLSSHNKALLGRAKLLQRKGKLQYAGLVNGKILIKSAENTDVIRVKQMTDMDQFEQ